MSAYETCLAIANTILRVICESFIIDGTLLCHYRVRHPYTTAVLDMLNLLTQRMRFFPYHNDLIYYFTISGYRFRRACRVAHDFSRNVVREREQERQNKVGSDCLFYLSVTICLSLTTNVHPTVRRLPFLPLATCHGRIAVFILHFAFLDPPDFEQSCRVCSRTMCMSVQLALVWRQNNVVV